MMMWCRMTTSKTTEIKYTPNGVKIKIYINPQPASRPRVTRWGTYYGKKYAEWMKLADQLLPMATNTLDGPLSVKTDFFGTKPKTTKRSFPVGDIDKHEKAIWDVLTKKQYWVDDDLITHSRSSKQYADGEGYITIEIKRTSL